MRRPQAREALRAWYRPRRRAYAWRRTRDPYAVLVSEFMLQQTQAPRVEPLFTAFLQRFPSVATLGEASRADVLRAWAGLGYNRRAVRLHEAARAIVREHDGRVPSDLAALLRLPGVGPYTASAVASIAFGDRTAARRRERRPHRGEGPTGDGAGRALARCRPRRSRRLDRRRGSRRLEPGLDGSGSRDLPAGATVLRSVPSPDGVATTRPAGPGGRRAGARVGGRGRAGKRAARS